MTSATRPDRVLVTGARGFVGRHVLPLLHRRFDVHAVSSVRVDEPGGATWHTADLLDAAQAEALVRTVQPTHLLHLAWDTRHGLYWNAALNLRWLAASLTLLDAFHDAGGRRFVGVGTCAEYSPDAGIAVEGTTPERPSTLYGQCKLAFGRVALDFCQREGIEGAWSRLFYLFGPGEVPERLVPSIVLALQRGGMAECRNPQLSRDYMYVGDAAAALAALLASPVTGVVNVASGVPIRLGELTTRIAGRAGAPQRVTLHQGLDDRDPPLIGADVRRLTGDVGWHSTMPLERAIDETIAWWRRHA